MRRNVSVSIVLHQQSEIAANLIRDLKEYSDAIKELFITFNIPERNKLINCDLNFPINIINNSTPKGFGSNHNFAFHKSRGYFFCIINPDIRLTHDPLPELIKILKDKGNGVASPLIQTTNGESEDNFRRFPTPFSIAAKLFNQWPKIEYLKTGDPFQVDWAAGMFMLFRSETYKQIRGFDERYHLYYEDVDICVRLKIAGYRVMACPSASVIHNARRESHRNPRYMKWHLQSMLRFFVSRTYRQALALKST